MGIVLFGHPRVAVAKLAGDNCQRHSTHGQPACIGMTQDVKTDGWNNVSSFARVPHEPDLMATAPGFAVLADENQIGAALVRRGSRKKLLPLVGQKNVP